jgi:hypothetical protein
MGPKYFASGMNWLDMGERLGRAGRAGWRVAVCTAPSEGRTSRAHRAPRRRAAGRCHGRISARIWAERDREAVDPLLGSLAGPPPPPYRGCEAHVRSFLDTCTSLHSRLFPLGLRAVVNAACIAEMVTFLLPMVSNSTANTLSILRVFRLLRLFRLARRWRSLFVSCGGAGLLPG